jgi:peptidoglycan/xylan/chitin deacetylase (PgdA/CDA1 family)
MQSRKDFSRNSTILGAGSLLPHGQFLPSGKSQPLMGDPSKWRNGSCLVISISMNFEAGGEPETGADSPFPPNLEKGYTDLPAKTWFQYGYKEGIPRLLNLWDKYGIKVTNQAIGEAVKHNPELAKAIVRWGHELSGHGLNWTPQYTMSYEEEKKFIKAGMDLIEEITGQTTVGYNCNWLSRSKNTLTILQELGFLYHIGDLSRDEPFLIPLNGKYFVVVLYTLRCNDIQLLEGRYFSSAQFGEQLKLDLISFMRKAPRASARCRLVHTIGSAERRRR